MLDIDRFLDEIDAARVRRVKELSEIKRRFSSEQSSDPMGINSKAAVVLTYAAWEGFYNECARLYIQFLRERGGKVCESDWMLLVAAFTPEFESLKAKHHSFSARKQFIENLCVSIECGFDALDGTMVEARSNLNYERLSQNYTLLNFDLSSLKRYRIRLDKELVGWRHSVAHGDQPDLSQLDIAAHVDFASDLFLVVADRFQHAMLDRMSGP